MITRYEVSEGGLTGRNMGRYVDWERNEDGGDAFASREEAERCFAECRDNMRHWFVTEWNCSSNPYRMMDGRGCFVELQRVGYETAEDLEDGNPAEYETLDYAQYTYDDYTAERDAE